MTRSECLGSSESLVSHIFFEMSCNANLIFPQPPCLPNLSYFLGCGLRAEGPASEVAWSKGSSDSIKVHTDGACVPRSQHRAHSTVRRCHGTPGREPRDTPVSERSQDAWAIRLKMREPQSASSSCRYWGSVSQLYTDMPQQTEICNQPSRAGTDSHTTFKRALLGHSAKISFILS